MSPALLSKRLRTLERAGVVRHTVDAGQSRYTLTECGEELRGIVEALGVWGVRWIGRLGEDDLDPHLLMWDIRRTISISEWPRQRTVVAFHFDDVASRASRWWLCVSSGDADLCDYDPGFEAAATVETSLRTFTEVWRGDRDWSSALETGLMHITAPHAIQQAVPKWVGQMPVAAVPRPA